MQQQLIQQIILQYTVDDDKLSKVNSAANKMMQDLHNIAGSAFAASADLARLGDVVGSLSRVSTLDHIAQQMFDIGSEAGNAGAYLKVMPQLLHNIGASSDEIDRVINKFKQLKDEADLAAKAEQADALGYGNVPAEGLRRTGSAFNQLGATGIGNTIRVVGDLQQISREIDIMAAAFTKLPGLFGMLAEQGDALAGSWGTLFAVIGPFAALIGVGVVAWGALQSVLSDANKALQDAETSVESYFDALGKGTTESLDKQLEDAKSRRTALEGIIKTNTDALQSGTEDAAKNFGEVGGVIVTGLGLLGAFGGGLKDVTDATTKAQDELSKLNAQIKGLENASQSAAVKFNTFVSKQIQDTEDFIATRKQVSEFEHMSASSLTDRVEGLKMENTILNEAKLRLQLSGASGAVFNKEMEKLNDLLTKNKILQDAANAALAKTQAAEDEANKKKEAGAEAVRSAESNITLAKQEASDSQMTLEAQKKRLEVLKQDQTALEDNINYLQRSGSVTKEVTDKIADYTRQLDNNKREQGQITDVTIPAAKALEEYNAQMKEQAKAIESALNAIDKARDLKSKLDYSIEDINTGKQEDLAKIERDAYDKRKSELDKFSQDYIDLEQKYADKRVEIATKAVESAQDDYTRLSEKLRDMTITLGQANEKDERDLAFKLETKKRDAAKEELDNLQQHLAKLKQIRDSTYESDIMALLNVNFLQLAKNRLTKAGQIGEEDTRYATKQNQTSGKLADDIKDETRAVQHARDERIIAYAQQSEDEKRHLQDSLRQLEVDKKRQLEAEKKAEIAADQQLIQHHKNQLKLVEEAHDKQIRELNIHIDNEIAAKRVGYNREIRTIFDEQKANMVVLKNFIENIGKSVLPAITSIGTGLVGNLLRKLTGRAEGGPLDAFQQSLVNEPNSSGNESFTNSFGNSVKFPGFGIFTPLTGGTVNPRGSQGGTVQHNWYITGSNADEIVRKVEPIIARISAQTFNSMTGAN